MTWGKVISYISVFSPLIPLILVIGKRPSIYQWIILLFVALSFSADLLSMLYINIVYRNNMTFLHVYGLLEGLVLIWFFSKVIEAPKIRFLILGIVFSFVYVLNSLHLEYGVFNALGRFLQSTILIILSINLFYQFYKKEEDIILESSPLFWFNAAILVYFSGAFFSFLLAKLITLNAQMWIFHNISNILKNLLIGVGVWKITSK